MHYYRRDGVWNGAGHQSRAPFEEMMHWGKMQHTLGCRALAVNDPRISNNILPASVDKMQCSTHKYGWDEKWIGQNRGDTSGTVKRISGVWKSVMVVLVRATVLRLHYDVCAHKSHCQGCFCGPSNKNELFIYVPCPENTAPIDWGNWSWLGSWCSESSVYLVGLHILVDVDTNAWWSICSEQKCHTVLLQLQTIPHVLKEKHKHL